MSKVYGYGRLALANEEEKMQQLKVIDDYCAENNVKVDEYFFDNGASGLTLDRKDLKKLLNVIQQGDIVVIPRISVLSRSSAQCLSLLEQMNDLDITLVIIDLTKQND